MGASPSKPCDCPKCTGVDFRAAPSAAGLLDRLTPAQREQAFARIRNNEEEDLDLGDDDYDYDGYKPEGGRRRRSRRSRRSKRSSKSKKSKKSKKKRF